MHACGSIAELEGEEEEADRIIVIYGTFTLLLLYTILLRATSITTTTSLWIL